MFESVVDWLLILLPWRIWLAIMAVPLTIVVGVLIANVLRTSI